MASYRKRGDGYQVQWRDLAGVQRSRQAPDLATARQLQRAIEQARALGQDWRPRDRAPTADLTELMQAYLDHAAGVRGLAPATQVQLHVGLTLFLRYLRVGSPRGRLLPHLLNRESVEGFYLWMLRDRYWQGRQGMSRLTAFQHARKVARAWRWLHSRHPDDIAPYVDVELPEAQPELRPRLTTWADCDAAIAATRVEWHRRLMIACRYTGLRRGQVMRLLWSDVDLDAATLTVRPELGKSRAERRGRTVPISPHLVAELAGWGVREGWLITTTGEERRLDYAAFRRAWTEATGERPRQPFHSLRKAHKAGLTMAGVAPEVRDYLLGHHRGIDEVYVAPEALMAAARAAVALIPPVNGATTASLDARRRAAAGVAVALPAATAAGSNHAE